MAVSAKYTEQMPFVGTPTQAQIVDRESNRRGVSKAVIIREAVDAHWGLVDGEIPDGGALPEWPRGPRGEGAAA